MVIVLVLYLALVYLIFVKFRWVPWNAVSGIVVVLIGVMLSIGFLVGIQTRVPLSSQGAITGGIQIQGIAWIMIKYGCAFFYYCGAELGNHFR